MNRYMKKENLIRFCFDAGIELDTQELKKEFSTIYIVSTIKQYEFHIHDIDIADIKTLLHYGLSTCITFTTAKEQLEKRKFRRLVLLEKLYNDIFQTASFYNSIHALKIAFANNFKYEHFEKCSNLQLHMLITNNMFDLDNPIFKHDYIKKAHNRFKEEKRKKDLINTINTFKSITISLGYIDTYMGIVGIDRALDYYKELYKSFVYNVSLLDSKKITFLAKHGCINNFTVTAFHQIKQSEQNRIITACKTLHDVLYIKLNFKNKNFYMYKNVEIQYKRIQRLFKKMQFDMRGLTPEVTNFLSKHNCYYPKKITLDDIEKHKHAAEASRRKAKLEKEERDKKRILNAGVRVRKALDKIVKIVSKNKNFPTSNYTTNDFKLYFIHHYASIDFDILSKQEIYTLLQNECIADINKEKVYFNLLNKTYGKAYINGVAFPITSALYFNMDKTLTNEKVVNESKVANKTLKTIANKKLDFSDLQIKVSATDKKLSKLNKSDVTAPQYNNTDFEAVDIMEFISKKLAVTIKDEFSKYLIINSLKYMLRLGSKDDVKKELYKAENYLHRARTGKWIK